MVASDENKVNIESGALSCTNIGRTIYVEQERNGVLIYLNIGLLFEQRYAHIPSMIDLKRYGIGF